MNAKHTPEPWTYNAGRGTQVGFLITARSEGIARTSGLHYDNEANARRIVACVNVCAGLPTESLEKLIVSKGGEPLDYVALRSQRDELADVIRALLVGRETMDGRLLVDENSPLIDAARTAIAKVSA